MRRERKREMIEINKEFATDRMAERLENRLRPHDGLVQTVQRIHDGVFIVKAWIPVVVAKRYRLI